MNLCKNSIVSVKMYKYEQSEMYQFKELCAYIPRD